MLVEEGLGKDSNQNEEFSQLDLIKCKNFLQDKMSYVSLFFLK